MKDVHGRRGARTSCTTLYARRTNLGPFRRDVNALWDLAPHDVAIFNYLLGETPRRGSAPSAHASCANGREDVGFVSLGYPGGLIGHIHVSWADPHKVREFVVVGSDSRIVFNDLDPIERVRVFDKGVRQGRTRPRSRPPSASTTLQIRDGDIVEPGRRPAAEPLKHLSGHFLHCVRRGDAPLTTGAPCARRRGRDAGDRGVRCAERRRRSPSSALAGAVARMRAAMSCRSRSLTWRYSSAPSRTSCRRRRIAQIARTDWILGARSRRSSRSSPRTARSPYAVGVDYGAVGTRARPAGLRGRPGRRGHHGGEHVHRDGARDLARRRDARPGRRRPRHPHDRPRAGRGRRSPPRTARSCRSTSTGSRPTWTRSMAVAERHGLVVIEDACQAHGARYRGRRAGSLGTRRGVQLLPGEEPRRLGDGGASSPPTPRCTNRASPAQLRPAREVRPRLDGLQPPPRHAPGAVLRVKLR